MNWAWASSLDQIWRSPNFPMWLTLAAAGFFGLVVLVMMLRADRSVANGALAVITLLSIGVAGTATVQRIRPGQPGCADGGRVRSADKCGVAAAFLYRRPRRRRCPECLREGAVRFRRVGRGGRGLRGLADHAADFARRCRHREQGRRLRPAGAAPRGRARSLRTDGLRADDARPLHAVGMRRCSAR